MIVDSNQIFNLMDTNGRRKDLLNAYNIYLRYLANVNNSDDFVWSNFPNSLHQFNFYKNAIEKSKDIFQEHPKFDSFYKKYFKEIRLFEEGNKEPLISVLSYNHDDLNILDKDIEARARHYSSNLCKLGLTTANRKLTPAGKAFLNNCFNKDDLESLLPITPTNIVMLRQLMKLKIFSKSKDGVRYFYSPFNAALYLLIQKKHRIDENAFRTIIQSLSPYCPKDIDIDNIIDNFESTGDISFVKFDMPNEFYDDNILDKSIFTKYFKNRKSGKTESIYYDFYKTLYIFAKQHTEENFNNLLYYLKDPAVKDKIKKAFGYGQNLFFAIDEVQAYGLDPFLLANSDNELLIKDRVNCAIYQRFVKSKYFDNARECSDTTKRVLGSTGLFKFDKALPELAYKDIIESIFDVEDLKENIFGSMTEEEFLKYENDNDLNSYYYSNLTIQQILSFNEKLKEEKIKKIEKVYKSTRDNLLTNIKHAAENDFESHINSKYTKETIIKIMRLFSDRSNDQIIKKMVNPEASVPTIYEYIVGIAWYYLSDKQINLLDSLNLTLNGDFEPILHAGGGDGDIIIKTQDIIIMLEVTLMDKNAQKRGEMEPVMRHSTNLKGKYGDRQTITFFVANELDNNTVTTWRLAFSAPLRAANGNDVKGITIMPFTNDEICQFIEKNITTKQIVEKTQFGFNNGSFDINWRNSIVKQILA